MPYLNDTMRVEMSLPVHMMLCVLLSGANCADPGPAPSNQADPYFLVSLDRWNQAWARFNKHLASDPEFARSYKTFKRTKELLLEACGEPLKGLYPERKELSVIRRIEQVHVEIVKPLLQGESPDPRKIGIVAFYLLQHLVDTETLIVPEDSAFGQALETMLPALSPWEGSSKQELKDYEQLNRSARKQARKMLQRLQDAGYYRGIPLPDFD